MVNSRNAYLCNAIQSVDTVKEFVLTVHCYHAYLVKEADICDCTKVKPYLFFNICGVILFLAQQIVTGTV